MERKLRVRLSDKAFPGRLFQLWAHHVSHQRLLIRSPQGPDAKRNIDLRFYGVGYLSVPTSFRGITLTDATLAEVDVVRKEHGELLLQERRVYVLASAGKRFIVVAADVVVEENDMDMFGNPFEER